MSTVTELLTIKDIIVETPRAKTFVFDIPTALEDSFRYRAGQYITLVFTIDDKEERRSYSMSSAPSENIFSVSVKQVEGGIVSNHMANNLSVGDQVKVISPEGRFVYSSDPERKAQYYFVAAGSGITPIMSHIKELLELEPLSTVYLLYGNKNAEDTMFKQQLDMMQDRHQGQFYVQNSYSEYEKKGFFKGFLKKNNNASRDWEGRIDKSSLNKLFKLYPTKDISKHAFVCGPEDMNEEVPKMLMSIGWNKSEISVESFGSTPGVAPDVKNSGDSNVVIELDGNTIELSMDGSQTVLEKLLEEGHDPPYSCSSGVCSSCIAKISKGTVSMDVTIALDEEEIAEGYILTCQSRPTSDEVEIKYE